MLLPFIIYKERIGEWYLHQSQLDYTRITDLKTPFVLGQLFSLIDDTKTGSLEKTEMSKGLTIFPWLK